MRAESRRLPALLALVALLLAGCGPRGLPDGGHIVHREKSMDRDIIVAETGGYRCLSFARRNGMQTCVYKGAPDLLAVPYTRAVFAGLMARPGAKRVLIIGAGGGVIPRAMHRFDPTLQIDVVELDPAVVVVAKRWFGYREDARVRTHIGDGRTFVRRSARAGVRYDLVVIDAYERVYVPEHLLTREFLSQVRDVLAPHGVVASNTFARGALAPYEAATYAAVFGPIQRVDVEMGNRILLAGRDGLPSPAALHARAEAMQLRLLALGVLVDELRSRPQAPPQGIRPLTDQYAPANLLFRAPE